MGRFKIHASKTESVIRKHSEKAVTNFMGGTSYTLNPLSTLKIVAASSIFGEPAYYRDGVGSKNYLKEEVSENTTADIFTKAIDNALDFDFKGTLEFASELRKEYFMRMNPAVIFIRASIHPNRVEFNKNNPEFMRNIGKKIVERPDDITNQFMYYMYINGSKNNLPNIVKRSWAENLAKFDRYRLSKYQTKGMLKDLVRISHAKSFQINELMQTKGVLKLEEDNTTWERLRSSGKSWKEIFNTIKVPHMALLRNLRGIFEEIDDYIFAKKLCEDLKHGVKYGKQFPFRYYTAMKYIEASNANHKGMLKDTLNECVDLAMENFPTLKGKTMCLSDNSGSAWGALTTEYGSTVVAEIDNLSSFITSYNSDEGYVGYFGDKLEIVPVSKRDGVLSQMENADLKFGRGGRKYVGGGTEHGIWVFFEKALNEKLFYDNIFIYSDMQAGHGGLYGFGSNYYKQYTMGRNTSHIDVLRLVEEYRKTVNPKVNVFSVQTAGYDNSVLPENIYRGSILTGWTGKEALYAKSIIDTWDEAEK